MKEAIRICIFGVLLVLIGCRSESVVETDELHQENMKKIIFFENYEKGNIVTYEQEDLNYADYSNPAIPFAQSVKYFLYQNSQIKKNIERKFGEVDFTMSTQVFRNEETGDKMVCFPIMKNGLIVHLLSVVVNKEYSYFYFRAMKGDESDFFNDVLTSFKKRRMFYNMKESLLSNEGDNRVNGYIGEVVIIKYNGLRRPHMEIVWSWGRDGNDGSGGGGGPSMGMGFPTGEGDGGRSIPPQQNNTPCEKVGHKNKESKSIMDNKNITDKISEMARNLKTDKNEKSFTFGKDTSGVYKTADIKEGNNMTASFSPISSSFTTEGIVHTHTTDLYSAQSVGDIYSLYKANSLNNNFIYNFAISIGETYVISIVDANKFKRFNQQYPESEYFDVENVDWKRGSVISYDFNRAYRQFRRMRLSENDAFGYAMASVMKKYDMGIIISKRLSDFQGEFKTLYVDIQENMNIRNRHNRYNYTKTENCNH